jgi:hypothetical protein
MLDEPTANTTLIGMISGLLGAIVPAIENRH